MIEKMKKWNPVFLPRGKKEITTKCIFNHKRNYYMYVTRHRARLVAKGLRQTYGVDYDEVFDPLEKYTFPVFTLALAVPSQYQSCSWKRRMRS